MIYPEQKKSNLWSLSNEKPLLGMTPKFIFCIWSENLVKFVAATASYATNYWQTRRPGLLGYKEFRHILSFGECSFSKEGNFEKLN